MSTDVDMSNADSEQFLIQENINVKGKTIEKGKT
jgi:hypothetical protein